MTDESALQDKAPAAKCPNCGMAKAVRIEVGRVYVWEPDTPTARTVVRVTRIVVDEYGEVKVWCTDGKGNEYWNEADRFQEACVYAA